MNEVTRALNALSAGDDAGTARLFESVYRELRQMAAGKMAVERAGHTLQATALVHEAYLRLAGEDVQWENRRHFFGAASEAMRRILVENARRRAAGKRGDGVPALEFDEALHVPGAAEDERLLQVHEALESLEQVDPRQAQIVKLRVFAGLSHGEIAAMLDLGEKTVRRHWELAKVRLFRAVRDKG